MADIYTTPAMQAPKGQTSNLVDPYSRKASRISLAAAALAVVLIFVSIRLIVRRKVKKFNSEDCKKRLRMISCLSAWTDCLAITGVLLAAIVCPKKVSRKMNQTD